MLSKSLKDSFIILNERGLHTRPSTELVRRASEYKCHIHLSYRSRKANAKSLLSILMLAASRGARIDIQASGEDAEEAIQSILALAANKFYNNMI